MFLFVLCRFSYYHTSASSQATSTTTSNELKMSAEYFISKLRDERDDLLSQVQRVHES
jgi:hypothetical protein